MGVDHAVPAHAQRAKQIEVLAAEIEDSGPFRPQQPLVAVGRQEVDRRAADVQRKNAQPLDGIQEQQGPPAVDHFRQPVQVLPPTAGVGDPTDADDPRAARRRPGPGVQQTRPSLGGHTADFHAPGDQVQPGILVRGELVVRQDDVIPLLSRGNPPPPG